jgi:hypothetical protein
VNELWNLLPVDRTFNQRVKRDKVPDSGRLAAAEPWLAAAYATYLRAPTLQRAVREDAALRFTGLGEEASFAPALANRAVRFIEAVAAARYVQRF